MAEPERISPEEVSKKLKAGSVLFVCAYDDEICGGFPLIHPPKVFRKEVVIKMDVGRLSDLGNAYCMPNRRS